jgi:hypothetical protein
MTLAHHYQRQGQRGERLAPPDVVVAAETSPWAERFTSIAVLALRGTTLLLIGFLGALL